VQAPRDDDRPASRTGPSRAGDSAFGRIERVPPLLMLLYVGLVGISMVFVTLVALYLASRGASGVRAGLHPFPRYFSLSTVVLLLSSYVLAQAGRLYRADDLPALARCLGATLLLGSVFSVLQVLGWRELMQQGVLFQGHNAGTFVYVISGVHVAHVLAGLLWLLAQLLRTIHASRDAVRTLVFIRNPYHRRQLRALSTYWHFIDALWLVLFAVFLLVY